MKRTVLIIDETKQRAKDLDVLYFIEKPLNPTFLPLAIEAIFECLELLKQQESE